MSKIVLVLGGANRYANLLGDAEVTNVLGEFEIKRLGASNTTPERMVKLIKQAGLEHRRSIIAYVLPPDLDTRFRYDIYGRTAWHNAAEVLPRRIKELEVCKCHAVVNNRQFYIAGLNQFASFNFYHEHILTPA